MDRIFKYKCSYKKLVFNKIMNKMELKYKDVLVCAKNKQMAIKFVHYMVGEIPFKVVRVKR